jgi:cell division protease FtsH
MTATEERVVATHEAGHAVVALFCEHAPPIDRISIQGNISGALGFVQHKDPAHKYVVTQGQLLDRMCVLMGGREGEQLLLNDLSIGSSDDLDRATGIARAMVEDYGLGGVDVGVRSFSDVDGERLSQLSSSQRDALDRRVGELVEEARQRAAMILKENQRIVELLRDELLQHKVIESSALKSLVGSE